MHLIPISREGSVRLSDVTLPELAMSVMTQTVQLYERRGYVEPWVGYLAVEGGNCVGTCGFTSPPPRGVAEIAYFTFPDFEKRGVATRMAQCLSSIPQECAPTVKIIAHTSTEQNASTQVLTKLGYLRPAAVNDPEDGNIREPCHDK